MKFEYPTLIKVRRECFVDLLVCVKYGFLIYRANLDTIDHGTNHHRRTQLEFRRNMMEMYIYFLTKIVYQTTQKCVMYIISQKTSILHELEMGSVDFISPNLFNRQVKNVSCIIMILAIEPPQNNKYRFRKPEVVV